MSNEIPDVRRLGSDMVKLQNDRIAFAAVNARMRS